MGGPGSSLDDVLAHHGIKGMHWGVRKNFSSIKTGSQSHTLKTKSGEELQLEGQKTALLGKLAGSVFPALRKKINNSDLYYIKNAAGKKVGELYTAKDPDEKNALNVVWVDTNKDQRGKGYATGVMKKVIDIAKQEGRDKVTLEVPGISPDAKHIYEKLGFQDKGTYKDSTPNDIWGGLTRMELQLPVKHSNPLEEVLEHHGVKGMHWGSHLSKTLEIHTRVANGTGSARDKLYVRANMSAIDFARSKGSLQAHAKFIADKLQARKDRFESGTETKTDQIERLATYNAYDFIKARNNKKQVEHFDQTLDEVLAHHGIKGQKWGVRRDRGHEGERASNRTIAKADEKFDKANRGIKGWVRVQNTFAEHINPEIEKLNNDPKYKNKPLLGEKNAKLYESYLKDYDKLVDAAAKATTDELGMNASGTKQIKVTRDGTGANAGWKAEFINPSAGEHDGLQGAGFTITPKFDALGHIVSFTVTPNAMAQADDYIENFLAHHGVKGMHWGVKRAISSVRSGHATRVAEKPAVSEDHRKAQAAKAKVKSGGTKTLSNEELQSLVSRMNLEQQLSRLNEAQPSKFQQGQSVVKKVLATGKTVNDVIAFVNSPTGKAVRSQIEKQIKKQAE